MRELAAADRQDNFDFIRGLRDDAKADPELRFEAAKLLAQYSDGKPITAALPGAAVQVNIGTQEAPLRLTGAEAYSRFMKGHITDLSAVEIVPTTPRIAHQPSTAAHQDAIDVQAKPSTASVVAAPARSEARPTAAATPAPRSEERPVSAALEALAQLGAEEPPPAEPRGPTRAEVERDARERAEALNNETAARERAAGVRRAHALAVEQARLDGLPPPPQPGELQS